MNVLMFIRGKCGVQKKCLSQKMHYIIYSLSSKSGGTSTLNTTQISTVSAEITKFPDQ